MDALQRCRRWRSARSWRRVAEARRIDAGLAQIEAGEYGACVECGEDILEKRLRLDAAVPVCVECAR